jgi:hypothetical protein
MTVRCPSTGLVTPGGAQSIVTGLGLPFLLEALVLRLALAVDGDPATIVPGPGRHLIRVGPVSARFVLPVARSARPRRQEPRQWRARGRNGLGAV